MKKFILSSVLFVVCMASQAFAYEFTDVSFSTYDALTGGKVSNNTTKVGVIVKVTGKKTSVKDPDTGKSMRFDLNFNAVTFNGRSFANLRTQKMMSNLKNNDNYLSTYITPMGTGTFQFNIGYIYFDDPANVRLSDNKLGNIFNADIQIYPSFGTSTEFLRFSASEVVSFK